MRAPVRFVAGGWPRFLERRLARFFWHDPTVIASTEPSPAEFRAVMSALHVGNTIKITGTDRHPQSDALIVSNLTLDHATILDIGASDGSTSVDLIRKIKQFGSYIIADLYFHVSVVRVRRHMVFYDQSGNAVLIVGQRLLAWPSQSWPVRTLYFPLLQRALKHADSRQTVLLLNPEARQLVDCDPRVTYATHDVFQRWTGPTPDLIKVANLLRRLYFSDDTIRVGLRALHHSLPDGGHLLIVDNPRIAGIAERGCLYRKQGSRFRRVAQTDHLAEIDDLVRGLDADQD